MEKEEQKLELAEVEEQEEEETTLVVRKSRNENDSSGPEIAAVSDGVSNSNGHTSQTEVAENGAKNEELIASVQEEKIEEADWVLENESEAINGENKSENLVFHDQVEGIWKCRICSWTHRNGSVCVDNIQNHKGQLHKLMNLKTLNFESEGIKSATAYFGEKQIVKDPGPKEIDVSSLDFIVQNNSTSVINNGYEGGREIEKSSNSISSLQPNESSIEIKSAEIDLINEDDLEVTEFDVEKVLQKQTTHDLYCPNCNSCITKRVILRKRKRRVQVTDEEVKRNKIETAVQSPTDGADVLVGDNDTQEVIADEDENERRPDIFRCLSCFSFFIPTGNGFKLFQIFGEKSGKENVRNEQTPSIKKNWFTSMFTSNKQETALEHGSSSQTNVSSNLHDQIVQPLLTQNTRSPAHASEGLNGTSGNSDAQEGGDLIVPFPNYKPSLNGKVIIGAGEKSDITATERVDAIMEQFDVYTADQLRESKTSQEVHVNSESDLSVTTLPMRTQVTNGGTAEDGISFSPQGGLKFLISSNTGYPTVQNFEEGQLLHQTVQYGDKEVLQPPPTSVSVLKASDLDGKMVSVPHEERDGRATIQTESVYENKSANFRSSDTGQVYSTEVSQHITTTTKIEFHSSEPAVAQGKDTVLVIDEQPIEPTQTVHGIIHATESASLLQSGTQSSNTDSERTEARKEFQIEVIKSIVYGGLAESITSLSVVSSAAGGGAATLNVLALGAANLIGGLFIVFHNLWDLKSDHIEQLSNQVTEQRDRYKELLGRRQNFILHAIVSILSYLIFGLVPPLVYCFSFRKSDDKQLKLVVVAAASLLCILILAIGKAYTQRPPKPYLKTVVTFVILGFMVSGVSYAAGELVERLLEKLGLFQASSVSNSFVPEMKPTGSGGWASY